MQNLKYPVKKIFIPSISLTDIKMYKSSEDGRFVLHFLKEGYSIKGQAAPAAFTDPTATTIQTGLQYLSRTTTNFGQPSSFLISIGLSNNKTPVSSFTSSLFIDGVFLR